MAADSLAVQVSAFYRAHAEAFQGVAADAYYEEGLRRSEIKKLEVASIGGALC